MSQPDGEGIACAACGAAVSGRFCSGCGQRVGSDVPSFRDFVAEGLQEGLGAERRLVVTLAELLARPGQLTLEFREGRGAAFVSPVRLYMLSSALFFALWAGTGSESLPLGPGLTAQASTGGVAAPALTVIAVPPLFAAVRTLAAFASRVKYVEFLVYALHIQVVLFLTGALSRVLPGGAVKLSLVWVYLLAYIVAAEYRLWEPSWPRAILKLVVVLVLYSFAASLVMVVAGAIRV